MVAPSHKSSSSTVDPQWLEKFLNYLSEKPGANDQWGRLMVGTNPVLIATFAMLIVNEHDSDLFRTGLREFGTKLAKGAHKATLFAKFVEDLNTEAVANRADVKEFSDLPETLRDYAQTLEGYSKISTELSSERLPGAEDCYLYFLHAYIVKSTEKPHWGALASILEAAHAANGHNVEIDDESLRKRVKGMVSRDPQKCSKMAQKAEQYIKNGNGEWLTRAELQEIAMDVVMRTIEKSTPPESNPAK